jgi:hypothetical protein
VSRYETRSAKPLYVETPLWEDAEPLRPDIQLDARKEVDTGLVTTCGKRICRVQPPIGFGRDKEW